MAERVGPRVAFVAVALIAGVAFFGNLDRLWPLADTDLDRPREEVLDEAAQVLARLGHDVGHHDASVGLVPDPPALDYVEEAFGREACQRMIAEGLPLFAHRVRFKRQGDAVAFRVELNPGSGLQGLQIDLEPDRPGARLEPAAARERVIDWLRREIDWQPEAWEEHSSSTVEQIHRRDHLFAFERWRSREPELRERITVRLAGDEPASLEREVVVPAAAERRARERTAPAVALETLGFVALAVAAVAAFVVFLTRLRDGSVRLGRAAVWPGATFVGLMATFALQRASLFAAWDPLWPRWVSDLRELSFRAIEQSWVLIVLLAVVAAGDALDRESGGLRGRSLWQLARGRFGDRGVALASGRGFLVGLICGGVMTVAVLLLEGAAGARVAIQPRGFFYMTLNSASPAVASLCFFFGVALAEELGYRLFGALWFLRWSRRRWIAVLAPAVIYGLTHTRLDFLPPCEPYWARPLVLALVGCVWGWAFLRFDALTVVLSHFTADLFIFNWPGLASGRTAAVAAAIAAIAVPLLPALLYPAFARRGVRPSP